LLPPPPTSGWPLEFAQQRAAYRHSARAELDAKLAGEGWPAELSPVGQATLVLADDAYPALRRATRLSYAIWAVISADDPVQPVLEAMGTSERLRMALLRMRDLARGL
jgi:hypothetical protein